MSSRSHPAPTARAAHSSSSARSGESAGAAPSGRRTKVPIPRRASTSPSRSSSRYAFRTVLGLMAVASTYRRGAPVKSGRPSTQRFLREVHVSVRYIRSVSWVVKPSRSYTDTAALLSAST